MNLTLAGQLKIEQADPQLVKLIKKTLSIKNPLHARLARMGNTRAMWGVPEYIKYFEEKDNILLCGRGFYSPLMKYICDNQIYIYLHADFRVKRPLFKPFKCDMTLRGYQEGVVDEVIKSDNGILRLDTGFGKSVIALKLIEALQQKTLIIVPRTHLKDQYFADIKKYCAGGPVDILTFQFLDRLNKRGELKGMANDYGMVIVDECHASITKKRLAVVQTFNAHYLYGMTATIERTDQQDQANHFTYGKILVDRKLPQQSPQVKVVEFTGHIPVRDYHRIIEDQVANESRNKLIADIINEEVESGRKCLVLTKRIAHAEELLKHLPQDDKIITIYADTKNKADVFMDLRSGATPFNCLIGTYSLLGTGSDIPSLDTLILAGDLKSSVLQKQSAGRILRLFTGKQTPKIVDIHDSKNPILSRQFKARRSVYNKLDWPII